MDSTSLNFEQLERDLENDPDDLELIQQWYQQLSEHEVDGTEPAAYLVLLFRAIKWVMQSEHTAAEELKEVAERYAIEMAEKDENWQLERDILKDEISGLREQITNQAGADATNEAFRAEIDSLNAENAHLKQLGRERDRELADQRDKVEELTGKVGVFERERNAWTATQIQLEDTIRELNRRLSAKTEGMPRGEYESRKFRQRSEQALRLSEQLRNADAQNTELNERVNTLTRALEEATSLLQETTQKYEKLREQFSQTATNAERLMTANRDLRQTLDVRNELITDKQQTVDVSTRQTEEVLRNKEAQIRKLRETNHRYEAELEKLHARLQLEKGGEREEELERLRVELVEATQLARRLFGDSLESTNEKSADVTSELRVRLVHLNRELDECREQLREAENDRTQLGRLAEAKDEKLVRAHGEVERLRKLAFGEAAHHVRDLEKQLEFRDRQVSQLTMRCSLMQLELEGITPIKTEDPAKQPEKPTDGSTEETAQSRRPRVETKKLRHPPVPTVKTPDTSADEKQDLQLTETSAFKDQTSSTTFEQIPLVNPPQTLTALELIRLLDENQIDDSMRDRDFLLRSLFVEFKRLSGLLDDRTAQLEAIRESEKENEVRLREERSKLRAVESKYAQVVEAEELVDESVLQRRIDELQIENNELNRLAASVRIGGSELERRFEEATRRLIHLSIQMHNYERQTLNLGRRHRALSDQCAQLRTRVSRLQTTDERRAHQLARENEMNMIEIARLQNALVHSVPARAYDRLLTDFKRLLHRQTLQTVGIRSEASDLDPGYASSVEEKCQFDITMSELLTDTRGVEKLTVENRELKTSIDVLERQNDHWQRQYASKEVECRELGAFLDDLENQSDVKSMIANIERRFLQALREQTDATDEQMSSEVELKRLRQDLYSVKRLWRQDRQRLVEVVGLLQLQMQRLRSVTSGTLTVAQLMALQSKTDELRDKERRLNEQLDEAERKISDLHRQRALAESSREAAEEMIRNDFDLQNLLLSLQRVHFHSKTLANELLGCQSKVQRVEKQLDRTTAENSDLKRELDEIAATAIPTSLVKLSSVRAEEDEQQTPKERTRPTRPQVPASILLRVADLDASTDESETSVSVSERTPRLSPVFLPNQTVTVESTIEYERRIEELKEAARLSIQSYKERLERKERALEEYKTLLEEMKYAATTAEIPAPVRASDSTLERSQSAGVLLNDEDEERERQLIALKWSVAELEDANARLANQLKEAHVSTVVLSTAVRDASIQTEKPIVLLPRSRNHSPASNGDSGDNSTQSADSGTVGDLSDEEQLPTAKRSNSTRTIEAASQAESQLYRERNEVRRLRSRLAVSERKNREITNECTALRQRTKHVRDVDPNAEISLIRRENVRLRRDAKRATEQLQTETERADQLEQRVRRHNENVRERADSWADRKNVENEVRTLRSKLGFSDEQIRELNEKLERRDRLIEKISRGQSGNAGAVEKIRTDLNATRHREAILAKAESVLRHENLVLQERLRECGTRAESALKQNQALRARLHRSTSTVEVQTPTEWALKAQTPPQSSTTSEVHGSAKRNNLHSFRSFDLIPVPRPGLLPTADRSTNTEERSSERTALVHQLRISELRYAELREQLEELQESYDRLDEEYTRFKRVRSSPSSHCQITAAVALLEDKLKGKQRELDQKRKRIEELEDTVQRWRLKS